MKAPHFDAPILFTIYNRPAHASRVFESIRRIQPRYLFVAADGPSPERPGDKDKCREARQIVNTIDWPCEVHKLFHEDHQGCRRAMSESINWFFNNVPEGIILEDDCLPHPSFFEFCRALLAFYRDDSRIMVICGDNKGVKIRQGSESYYFSRLVHIWGWATWRRAWRHFDPNLNSFPAFKERGEIGNIFPVPELQRFWIDHFESVYRGRVDTWDFQWVYAVWAQGGLSIMPRVNLVTNIGFGPDATHTTSVHQADAFLETQEIGAITHPSFVIPNRTADESVAKHINGIGNGRRGIPAIITAFRRLRGILSP